MDPRKQRIQAELLLTREGAGKYWIETFVRGHMPDINRRFGAAGTLHLTPVEKLPLELWAYIREALQCFALARYIASIALSSSFVELILNLDPRVRVSTELARTFDGWAPLSQENLRISHRLGLPVTLLLSSGESLEGDRPTIFLERQRKVAQGNISAMLRHEAESGYDSSTEGEALDQLRKAEAFLVAWFNTSPEIQGSSQK